jgi:hypothetical protein
MRTAQCVDGCDKHPRVQARHHSARQLGQATASNTPHAINRKARSNLGLLVLELLFSVLFRLLLSLFGSFLCFLLGLLLLLELLRVQRGRSLGRGGSA